MENNTDLTAKVLTNLSMSNKVAVFVLRRDEILYPTQMELVGMDSSRFCLEYLRRVATNKTRRLIERRHELLEKFLAKFRSVKAERTFLSANLTFNIDGLTALHFWFNPLDRDSLLVCVERERTWEQRHNPIILDAENRTLYAYANGVWRKDPRSLSVMQMQVAVLMAQGKSNKEIAKALNVSESTVAFHKRDIFGKMGATNSAKALHMLRALTVPPTESVGALANYTCMI